MQIVFVAPAFWPATAFGGPIPVMRQLAGGLVVRGHEVHVVTTTLEEIGRRFSGGADVRVVDGATVRYLATPLRSGGSGSPPALRGN